MRVFSLAFVATAVHGANPIRRVVTLLQEMSQEISATLEKERDMHEKFQCYCKKNDGQLDQKAKEAAVLIKKTKAEVDSNAALKTQLGQEIKKHKQERADSEKKLEAAIKKRSEEKSKYDEATKEQRKTIEDLDKAVVAIEKGMGRAFLQTTGAKYLQTLVESNSLASANLDVSSQQTILSFLSAGSNKDYASQSGEIVGILKMIKQNIDDALGGVIQEEEGAVKSFGLLKTSLEQLIKTSTQAIDKKGEMKGAAAVKVVEGKNLIANTEKQMGDDMATLAALKTACGDKGEEFNERQKDGAGELDAINQAIGVLNNDDSLELFKATDTKASLIQQKVSLLQKFKSTNDPTQLSKEVKNLLDSSAKSDNKAMALLAFTAKQALQFQLSAKQGQAVDFSKIYKMIDDMVALLKKEATDDLSSRDNCNTDLNDNAAETKEAENALKGHEATIADLQGVVSQNTNSIEQAQANIKEADVSVATATKQRKEENEEFNKAVVLNDEAVELIGKAKDKLNAYYNPQLVRKQQRVETNEEAATRASQALVQAHVQASGLPDGQPEIWAEGERKNQGQKGSSVLSLLDMLANDLNKDTQALKHAEETATRDYEKLVLDVNMQKINYTKAMNDAAKNKADAENELATTETQRQVKEDEVADLHKTNQDLHAQCDFILSAFDERSAARENEIEGLKRAKSVLAGAKFD